VRTFSTSRVSRWTTRSSTASRARSSRARSRVESYCRHWWLSCSAFGVVQIQRETERQREYLR
jgi:hypothetical protein